MEKFKCLCRYFHVTGELPNAFLQLLVVFFRFPIKEQPARQECVKNVRYAPNINFVIVKFLKNEFRCDQQRCTTCRVSKCTMCQLPRKAKISNFNLESLLCKPLFHLLLDLALQVASAEEIG
jgi:hypothetical protein